MDGSRTVWELPVSPTCLPNGPASARCLASLCCNLHSNRAGRGRNGPLSGRAPIRSRSRHRAASVASVGARSMGDSPTVWELPASATCRPNGLVSAPRDNSAENACSLSLVAAETRTRAAEPANSRLFASRQEISANARLRGGLQRIRTSCQAPTHIEPVSAT
jgi:hypothetical protein